jgi:TldD protein
MRRPVVAPGAGAPELHLRGHQPYCRVKDKTRTCGIATLARLARPGAPDMPTSPRFRPFETDLDPDRALALLREAVAGADDGELFLERRRAEALVFDDGRLRTASYDAAEGFGLRAVRGETAGYAHSTEISEAALKRAAATARLAVGAGGGALAAPPRATNQRLYADLDPVDEAEFAVKVETLREIDAYLRGRDPRVVQVSATLAASLQEVEILRPEGGRLSEARPMVRLNVSVIVEENGRRESGGFGGGGRHGLGPLIEAGSWTAVADEALRVAVVNLAAEPAPAGVMDVALGPGWPGILLHEAVGHGLEGDFNRKKTSAFAGLLGERVAAPGVTVVDDGTIEGRRGSISFDDEGTPSGRTVLIEDGVLVGYMQDRQNARLMGVAPTGNGRRESFAHIPMPRMTNTIMLGGDSTPADVVAGLKDGIYAVGFGGGQVDITNGKFVFSCTEAYRVKGGRIGAPVKGATLIGDGATALKRIRAIGDDMRLDPGIGNCGKNGQWVPVGVGQPTLLIGGLTVGGSAA